MVERDDLQRAETLNRLYREYQEALRVLDMNPRMVSFRIEPTIEPTDDEIEDLPPASVVVPAEGIQMPPQMMAAIKEQVEHRIDEINDQLSLIGVNPSPPPQARQKAPAAPRTPVSASGGTESRPTPQTAVSEPPKPATRSTSHHAPTKGKGR